MPHTLTFNSIPKVKKWYYNSTILVVQPTRLVYLSNSYKTKNPIWIINPSYRIPLTPSNPPMTCTNPNPNSQSIPYSLNTLLNLNLLHVPTSHFCQAIWPGWSCRQLHPNFDTLLTHVKGVVNSVSLEVGRDT